MMRENVCRDAQLDNGEELLLDLRGSRALAISAYAEDEDSVTRVLQVPEDAPAWLVAIHARDQRSLTTEQIHWSLAQGQLRPDMLVWRRGLPTWQLLGSIAELRPLPVAAPPPAPPVEPAPAEVHPPAPDPLVPPDIDLERLALESGSLRLKRAVMAVSAVAMAAVFVTLFSISSTSEDKVREAARQREAAEAVKPNTPARKTATPESAPEELESAPRTRQRAPRQRARVVPREEAAMIMGLNEPSSAENPSQAVAADDARQRL